MPCEPAFTFAIELQLLPFAISIVTLPPRLRGVRPQTDTRPPSGTAAKGKRSTSATGLRFSFAYRSVVFRNRPPWKPAPQSPLKGSSRSLNQIIVSMFDCHIRYIASAAQRACCPSGTPPGSGGLVSQPNSVTQNPGAPCERTLPLRYPDSSS